MPESKNGDSYTLCACDSNGKEMLNTEYNKNLLVIVCAKRRNKGYVLVV